MNYFLEYAGLFSILISYQITRNLKDRKIRPRQEGWDIS